MRASSSTMRMAVTGSDSGGCFRLGGYGLFGQRQENHEAGAGFSANRLAVEQLKGAAMLIHDFGHDGKSQAYTAFLGSEKWIENLFAQLGWNSWPRIRHAHLDAPTFTSLAQLDRNAQTAAAFTHGIVSVLYEI